MPLSPRNNDLGAPAYDTSLALGMRYSLSKLPSVHEVISKKQPYGITGYDLPHFNAALDKPRICKFSPTKQRKTFIDFAVKQKDFLPNQNKYNTVRDLLDPKKGLLTSKGKRKMFSEEIEDLAKKNRFPDPTAYDSKVKTKILGALCLKDERTTFADEAIHIAKCVTVEPYDAKYELVKERPLGAKIYPLKD